MLQWLQERLREQKSWFILRLQEFLLVKLSHRIFNALFNLNVKDTQCGCKAFKKEVLEKVLYNVESNGFEFDAELLFKCKRAGYKIREVPVTWSYKPDSKLSLFQDTLKMGRGVLKLWVKTYIVTQKT